MMIHRSIRVLPLAAAMVLGLGILAARAEIIVYREVFPNATGENLPLSTAGWFAHRQNGAEMTGGFGVSFATGRPTDAQPVNSNPASNELAGGLAGNWDGGVNDQPFLYWTNEFTVDRSALEVQAISWWQGNQSGSDAFRVALQIDGGWYASDQTFMNTPITSVNAFASGAEERSLDFATADWRGLNFVAGSSLSLGGLVAQLPGGDITAFGLFADSKLHTHRFDTYTITMVPEPGTWLLFFSAMACGLLMRRRRRDDG